MTKGKTVAIILAAGMGTRMKSSLPKVLHPLAGRPLIRSVLETAEALAPDAVAVVIGPDMDAVAAAVTPHAVAVQRERLGTAHAVLAARAVLENGDGGDVFVLYGDTPLLRAETLERLRVARRSVARPAVVVLGFRPDDPTGYGRLITGADGALDAVVEEKDATAEQRAIGLCNSGVMVIDAARALGLLDRIRNENAKSEFYLTDVVALARADGLTCGYVEGGADELIGVNSRQDLARAERIAQDRLRRRWMDGGVTMTAPETVFLSFDTVLGRDVVIGPNVVFGPGVTVGDGVDIRPFCHIEGATIAPGVLVGPFARLRPGARIAEDAHIGNFVEIKNATVEAGAKVNHLSYIGDARVGAKANIGAGTITCNYDGFFKSHTDIGAGAFIGSNTALVAPVSVGDGASIGAGSVITRDVAADALGLTRAPQVEKTGWARRFREIRAVAKAKAKKKT